MLSIRILWENSVANYLNFNLMSLWSKYLGIYVYKCVCLYINKICGDIFPSIRCGFILGAGSNYVRKSVISVKPLHCCKHVALPIIYTSQWNILLNVDIFVILITIHYCPINYYHINYWLLCFVISPHAEYSTNLF